MSAKKSILLAFQAALKGLARDLFGEDESPAAETAGSSQWQYEMQARLDGLLPTLAQIERDANHAAAQHQNALEQNARLDLEIRQARAQRQEERAHDLIDEQWRWRDLADGWEARADELAETRELLLNEMKRLRAQLGAVAERRIQAEEHIRVRQALAELEQLQREASQSLRKIETRLSEQEEKTNRLQDPFTAKRD